MRRRHGWIIEPLESRQLLSGLAYTLTTDQATYQAGQPIIMTFTETNTGDQPVTVELSPTDFTVSQGNGAIWQSDSGAAGQSPTSLTLQPGQSVSQTATWGGTVPFEVGAGAPQDQIDYNIPLNVWGSFTVTNPNAPEGLSATFQITDPLTVSLTTDQSAYQMGQPVQVTYTESNTSDQAVTFFEGSPSELTFWHNGQNVTPVAYPQYVNADPYTLAAHNTITWSQTWNGIPESGPYNLANLTGTFVASYGPAGDPQQYTTSFQIAPPSSWDIVTNISTSTYKSVDQTEQMVNMTFTETNAGDQPVRVVVGSQDFTITQNGQFVWSPPGASTSTNDDWGILPPGQTITQTDQWDGIHNSGQPAAAGTYVVTDTLDPNSSTATFQLVGDSFPILPYPIILPNPIVIPITGDPPAPVPTPPTGDPPAAGSDPTDPVPIGTTTQPPSAAPQNTGVPGVTSSVSLARTAYKVGQNVHLELQIESNGSTRLSHPRAKGREVITVSDGSSLVYKASRMVRAVKVKGARLSQALKLDVVWDGRSNQPGIHKLKPGTYAINVSYDGLYQAGATIQNEPRRS